MAEIAQASHGRKKFRKSSSRLSTRVDLTPMVDLGFLLITFFVFTTSMAQPKTMDLVEPVGETVSQVPESGAMTIILADSNRIYYYHGLLNVSVPLLKTDFKNIRTLILQKKLNTDITKLMYLIKSYEGSTFGDNINLLDEMAICEIPNGHYAEADLLKEEFEMIKLNK